tara:strand:- start:95 stop:436 length:342 start_codon:yes stop_codon:yes gene_type:complete
MAIRTETEQFLSNISNATSNAMQPGTTVHIDDTVAHTGPFFGVTALADAVVDVSECTINIIENGGSGATQAIATNFTIPKGVTIYGNFTSIELDSGSVLAYAKEGVTVTVASS